MIQLEKTLCYKNRRLSVTFTLLDWRVGIWYDWEWRVLVINPVPMIQLYWWRFNLKKGTCDGTEI